MSLPEACLVKLTGRTEIVSVKGGATGFFGRRGSVVSLLLVVLCLPLLSACSGGFKPLYGSLGANGESVADGLRKVDIAPIPGRVGQRIRNELIFGTTGGDYALDPTHRLEIAVRESVSSTLIEKTGDSESQVYNIDATFRLIELSSKKVVLEGKSFGRASFERFSSIFSNVRARKDAEDRAARTVGGDLKGQIAVFLSSAA